MNRLEFSKTTIYKILGLNLISKNEFYSEKFCPNLEDDTPPIVISKEYADKEFKIDKK